jgi:hypothetical protein
MKICPLSNQDESWQAGMSPLAGSLAQDQRLHAHVFLGWLEQYVLKNVSRFRTIDFMLLG